MGATDMRQGLKEGSTAGNGDKAEKTVREQSGLLEGARRGSANAPGITEAMPTCKGEDAHYPIGGAGAPVKNDVKIPAQRLLHQREQLSKI